jgi:hypothetical protein
MCNAPSPSETHDLVTVSLCSRLSRACPCYSRKCQSSSHHPAQLRADRCVRSIHTPRGRGILRSIHNKNVDMWRSVHSPSCPRSTLQGSFVETVLPQLIAKRSPTFNRLKLEVMAMPSSSVGERTATDVISNNAHEPPPPGYVGYSKSLSTVIVAHQGTDPSKL